MSSFINSKIRKSIFQLFRIREIRKSLTFLVRRTFATSLVLSVIDYCNILLSCYPAYKIKPLETILRSFFRVVYNISHCEKNNDISITLLMTKLNWMSVANRIKYKSCIYIHSAIRHDSHSYLSECVELIKQSRSLRQCHTWRIKSASQSNVNPVQLARSFADSGSSTWNSLPPSIRAIRETGAFKRKLKTFLLSL